VRLGLERLEDTRVDFRSAARGGVADPAGESFAQQRAAGQNIVRPVARISVLVRRLWAGLVFDGLAVLGLAPSNSDHVLPLIAQALGLGALGVARACALCVCHK
jgi:hypothetical protein